MLIICPTCKKRTTWEENPSRPFCSDRCRILDLGAWAAEEYRISEAAENNTEPHDDTLR